jgi:cytochrome c2
LVLITTAVVSGGLGHYAAAQGNVQKGEQGFKKCAMCHSLEAGKIKIGPPLYGLIGRKAGTVSRFSYSKAMKAAGIVWTPEMLDKYLANPKKLVPGNRMPFPGLKDPKDRADIIAYLQTMAPKK